MDVPANGALGRGGCCSLPVGKDDPVGAAGNALMS